MKRPLFSFPSVATGTTLIVYLMLSVGLTFLMLLSPPLGLIGALVINVTVLFFMRPRLALMVYILVAAPSLALTFSSGILSRLYLGNLLFMLLLAVWILRYILPERKSGHMLLERSLLIPLFGLILIALISIIYSRLFPDPGVSYSFVHSNVSLTIVNITEMALLIGVPVFLMVISSMVRTVRDVRWIIGAFIGIGIVYALGTIFAAPLGLYSQEVILGIRRPEVFGYVSSDLGTLLVLFCCIALGQALYNNKRSIRLGWSLLTFIFALAVIMSFGRTAWIALVLAVLVMVGLRLKNWSMLLVVLVFLSTLFIPGVSDFFNPGKVYGADRLQIAQDAISIWRRSPYMGIGAGNFQFFDIAYGTEVVGVAHNQYLAVLAEMGVQGLLCFLWVLLAIGRMAIKRFKTASTNMSRALALASVGYFATIISGGFFTGTFISTAASGGGTGGFVELSYTWLLLGLVLSIPNWEKEAEQSEQRNTQLDKKEVLQTQQQTVSVLGHSIGGADQVED